VWRAFKRILWWTIQHATKPRQNTSTRHLASFIASSDCGGIRAVVEITNISVGTDWTSLASFRQKKLSAINFLFISKSLQITIPRTKSCHFKDGFI
jgi:hypothetical protein